MNYRLKRQSPIISVILPTHNRHRSLQVAIQSVIDQTVTDWELYVIDDGSTKETSETVKKFQDNRIKYCRQEHNERSVARNLGILRSTGKYVCFLDDDDYLEINHLQVYCDYLKQNNYPLEIVRTGFSVKENDKLTRLKLYEKNVDKHPVVHFSYDMCGIWSLCIPREFLEKHQFPSKFPHWQDSHLALRLLALYPFKQLKAWTYVYCQHNEMGSIGLFKGQNIESRVSLQVDAINDLFQNYNDLINPFLGENDRKRLVSEKMYRGARILRSEGKKSASWKMFFKAPFSFAMLPSAVKFVILPFK